MRRLVFVALLCLMSTAGLQAAEPTQPTFRDVITVTGEAPLLVPVDFGQAVLVTFSVGELEISAADVGQVSTRLRVRCRRLSIERCESYRNDLQLVAETTGEQVSIRLAGLSLRRMRKLEVEGRIVVPRWAPLEVRMGIGDLNIDISGEADLDVGMRIGDLKIHVPEKQVSSVNLSVGIGDAGIRGEDVDVPTVRHKLLGARAQWDAGDGEAHITAHLRIGDVGVALD